MAERGLPARKYALHFETMKNFLYSLIVLAAFFVHGSAYAQFKPHAQIRLVPEKTKIAPGDAIFIAIEQTLESGWHSYWKNPGDSGEPMRVQWTMPDGFETGPLKWPTPHKIMIGPLASYGYEDRAVLLQEIIVPWDLPEGPLTLRADIDILVCEEICIPETSHYEVTFNAPGAAEDNAVYIDAAYEFMPATYDLSITFKEENDLLVFFLGPLHYNRVQANTKPGTTFTLITEEWGLIDNPSSLMINATARTDAVVLAQRRGDRPLGSFDRITGLLSYVTPSDTVESISFIALPDPDWDRTVAIAPPMSTSTPSSVDRSASGAWQDTSFIKAILFAVLGGLILNLMPCVFPVLSLKALKLCRMGGKELSHARMHGILYTGGILASFAVFAVALLVLQAAGSGVGWGFHLQNSGFVAFLAYLFLVIGLNLVGYFEVAISIGGRDRAREHGYVATFFSGVLAAVVATPCTAPFMGVAMGYALTQPPAIALSVFLALGFGLALPMLALSFVPALQKIMPKPGAWMDTFRKVLALPMLLAAAWLAWVFMQQSGQNGLIILIAGMVVVCLAIAFLKSGKKTLRLLALVLILTAAYPVVMKSEAPPVPVSTDGWAAYTAVDFASLEAGHDPLFVNMTAAWCITCKINEHAVLAKDSIRTLLDDNNVVLVKGDWTNYNAEITAYLESFGRDGVPLYVYYGSRDDAGKRPDPVILPQILTPSIIERTIK